KLNVTLAYAVSALFACTPACMNSRLEDRIYRLTEIGPNLASLACPSLFIWPNVALHISVSENSRCIVRRSSCEEGSGTFNFLATLFTKLLLDIFILTMDE